VKIRNFLTVLTGVDSVELYNKSKRLSDLVIVNKALVIDRWMKVLGS